MCGVAVDSSGNIFVGKLGPAIPGTNTLYYGEITKYNSAGSSLGQFALLPGPIMRMTIDSNNNLYVTSDSFDERLIKVTSSGSVSTLKTWLYGTSFGDPDLTGIGVDSSGNIYVGQDNWELQPSGLYYNQCCVVMKYSSSGSEIGSLGTIPPTGTYNSMADLPLGSFATINGIAFDSSGNIYVPDSYNNRITVFDTSGDLIRWFAVGSPSTGGNGVYGIAIDGVGNIYTAERGDNRVQIFPPNYGVSPEQPSPNDITAPVITVPYGITNSTSNSAGKTITFTTGSGTGLHPGFNVQASDDVGVTSGPTCSPPSGSNFSVGTTIVTCTASDAAGNIGTSTFGVTIVLEDPYSDTTPPTLVLDGISEFYLDQSGNVIDYGCPDCSYDYPNPVDYASSPQVNRYALNSTGYTLKWGIVAEPANGSPWSSPSETVQSRSCQESMNNTVINMEIPSFFYTTRGWATGGTYTFPVGTTTVTCTAEDAAENEGSTSFTVTVLPAVGPTVNFDGVTEFYLNSQGNVIECIDATTGWCYATDGDNWPAGYVPSPQITRTALNSTGYSLTWFAGNGGVVYVNGVPVGQPSLQNQSCQESSSNTVIPMDTWFYTSYLGSQYGFNFTFPIGQ